MIATYKSLQLQKCDAAGEKKDPEVVLWIMASMHSL